MTATKDILNYKIQGTGTPVVFLHGFLEDLTMWNDILPSLPGIQAVQIDLPGHGVSPLPSNLSLTKMATMVSNTLNQIGLHSFSIVGHSLGGYVALEMANSTSFNLQKIILFHSHPWADSTEKKINRERAARVVLHNSLLFINEAIPNLYAAAHRERLAPLISAGIQCATRMTPEAIAAHLYAMRDRVDHTKIMAQWGENLHVVQGEYDALIPAKEMEACTQRHGNHFHFIPNIAHMGHQEAPEKVIQILSRIQWNDQSLKN